jgi:hypothetical protein
MYKWLVISTSVLLAGASSSFADWSRLIDLPELPPNNSYDADAYQGFSGMFDGPVIADVIPIWPGKEIIQAARDEVYVIRNDNSEFREYLIPIIELDPVHDAGNIEVIAGQPAVGDVDNDGFLELIVGIMQLVPQVRWCDPPFGNCSCTDNNFYGEVVWWKWNASSEDLERREATLPAATISYLGTPLIAPNGFGTGQPAVIFFGPAGATHRDQNAHSECTYDAETNSAYTLLSFDLSDPDNVSYQRVTFQSLGGAQLRAGGDYSQGADFDGDGKDEIVVHTLTELRVYRYGAGGWVQWSGFPTFTIGNYLEGYTFADGYATVADVDNNGALDILVSVHDDSGNGRMLQLDATGTVIRTYLRNPMLNEEDITSTQPAVADISVETGSQQPGALYPAVQTDSSLHLMNSNTGAEYTPLSGTWPQQRIAQSFGDHRNASSPAYADVLGWGRVQIIDQTIGDPPSFVGDNEIRIYDPLNPDSPTTLDLAVPSILLSRERSCGAPAVADADNDGNPDMVCSFRTSTYRMSLFFTNGTHAASPEKIEWQQIGNGPRHTGLYAQPVTDAVAGHWSGRITVRGYTYVDVGKSLTIEPGTVVEFQPDAILEVFGTLNATGKDGDSIYFKPDGNDNHWSISVHSGGIAEFGRCVMHDGNLLNLLGSQSARVHDCHVYNLVPAVASARSRTTREAQMRLGN